MSHRMTKSTKWHVCLAKTQISQNIRPVWSESALSTWRKLGSLATHWAQQRLWSNWSGWSESSLVAHAFLLVLSWGGSNSCLSIGCKVSGAETKERKPTLRNIVQLWKKKWGFHVSNPSLDLFMVHTWSKFCILLFIKHINLFSRFVHCQILRWLCGRYSSITARAKVQSQEEVMNNCSSSCWPEVKVIDMHTYLIELCGVLKLFHCCFVWINTSA